MENLLVKRRLTEFLEEDIGHMDVTTDNLDTDRKLRARIVAKDNGIVAGIPFAIETFQLIQPDIKIIKKLNEGSKVSFGDTIIELEGSGKAILKAERVALNILQRLSGIATTTNKYVSKLKGYKTKLLDTRKTTPGFRYFEKYAVRVGGGYNHRFALYDMVMIKDNHIILAGGIKNAVEQIRKKISPALKIEVEVSNLEQLQEALDCKVDIIMLDNMSIEEMKKAVEIVNGRALLEASGNVTIDNIEQIASTGVDFISSGAVIHSSRWLDISLKVDVAN
jgi:nicotinate-nucleotide pyrophosphorylase (carboxylating)